MKRLLLVDDDMESLAVARARLRNEGVEICCATCGQAGIEAARSQHPDLILLDLDMPDMTGLEVCRILKADQELKMIPVIFLSGSGTSEDKVEGLNLGAVDYVAKPFDAFELKARVNAALRTKHFQDLLTERAQIDPLTGLANRRELMERLRREWLRIQRYGGDLSLIMGDVDHFKQINDTYGHAVGDRALREIANCLAGNCRKTDLPIRYGGEEFAIVVPNEKADRAATLAERCRQSIQAASLRVGEKDVGMAVSFGVTDASRADSMEAMIEQADEALYRAKEAGRNRVETWEEGLKAQMATLPLDNPNAAEKQNSTVRVLVAEDCPEQLQVLRMRLERAGYTVETAEDGEGALQRFRTSQFDLVISDVLMPRMDGIQLCRRIRASQADAEKTRTPVILLTANDSDQAIVDGLDAGADEYVTKPFSPTVLLARVRTVLRAKAAQDQLREANQKLESEVHERRRVEDALLSTEEQLHQAQKLEAVGRLAGGIAHEFNNLLQAISGYTRYAMDGLPSDDPRHCDLQQAVQAADRAATLTRQLLGFSRRQSLKRCYIDPNQVVEDAAKMVRPILGEHFDVDMSLRRGIGTMHADPAELQQVVVNLCINARDAMPAGGTVTLRTDAIAISSPMETHAGSLPPGDYILVEVTDTGCGMPPEVIQHLFEPFFTTKGVGKGTGLGLAMVYGVVQQHGGGIRVQSREGQGSRFEIYFPTVDADPNAGCEEACPVVQEGDETILLAEDDSLVRDLAVRTLQGAGYTVLAASDGEEALRLFDENRSAITLVILDAIMPKLTGHDVYRRLKMLDPEVKVIFCTGYDPETARSDYIAQEHLRLIEKPFHAHVLLETVRGVLDGQTDCQLPEGATA